MGKYLIIVLSCFAFPAQAQELSPYYGLECGAGFISSGIRDLRDSLPAANYRRLDDVPVFGGAVYGGFNYDQYDILLYLNWYGLFADFKNVFDDSTETAVKGDLSTYTLSAKLSYLFYKAKSEKLKLSGSAGYRNYSILGNLTMENNITKIQYKYEDSFSKYHNITLGAKAEYRLGKKISLGLIYDRFAGYNPASSYSIELSFLQKNLKDINARLFVNLVKSERYGYLCLGLKGDTNSF
jgi:hypothetical protein